MKGARQECKGYSRHWFREWGTSRTTPACQRCGAPNPGITRAERAEWDATREPPKQGRWEHCYGVESSTVEGERGWCSIHARRVNVGSRPERQGWHLYWDEPEDDGSDEIQEAYE